MSRAAELRRLALAAGVAVVLARDEPRTFEERLPGTLVALELVRVPGGILPEPDLEGRVSVTGFWMSRTEIPWDLYDVFLHRLDLPEGERASAADAESRPSKPYGAADRGFGHAGFPAIGMTRHAAEQFCSWLTGVTGRTYRLPTEAEWLHACLGGAARLEDDVGEVAWTFEDAGQGTHRVATKAANGYGLHDLLGNAAEWCAGPEPVVRGGSYRDFPEDVSPARREVQRASWNATDPQIPKSLWWLADAPFVGFRVVCDGPLPDGG